METAVFAAVCRSEDPGAGQAVGSEGSVRPKRRYAPQADEYAACAGPVRRRRLLYSRSSSLCRIYGRQRLSFHTKEGLECDAVVHLRNGQYGLVEIKLGGDKLIEEGVKTLKAIAGKIDTEKMLEPSFLMALSGTSPNVYCEKHKKATQRGAGNWTKKKIEFIPLQFSLPLL